MVLTNSIHFLSKRERQIFNLILEGFTTTEIAVLLQIKTNTVSSIKKNIYIKLNINSTVDLVKLAIKEGICSL